MNPVAPRTQPVTGSSPDMVVAPSAAATTDEAPAAGGSRLAPNYAPLPVTLATGRGAWVTDVHGRRYVDMLAGYSALNFGHRHPRLVRAARRQLDRLTLTSRAFDNDQLEPFAAELADLTDQDRVLPMNTGAEAVESAVKAARLWGYRVRGVPHDRARIIVCADNFHGRTTTIVGFSSDPSARDGFGPFTPGFVTVPFGDTSALAEAITDDTVAFLVEPIQGEAGVVLPPDGYLREVRRLCDRAGVLLIADEVQSGLGRTGRTFACDHENVRPDLMLLGKALGGGIMPISAVAGRADVLDCFEPGSHGSTFGGNPLACAVAREVMAMLRTGELQDRAAHLGAHMTEQLEVLVGRGLDGVRSRGLWAGVDVGEHLGSARAVCERLVELGVLVKDTHGRTLRLAPPLVIDEADLDHALVQLATAVSP